MSFGLQDDKTKNRIKKLAFFPFYFVDKKKHRKNECAFAFLICIYVGESGEGNKQYHMNLHLSQFNIKCI